MESIHSFIDSNEEKFIQRLRESVEIPSVSGWSTHRPECIRQMHHTKTLLDSFGAKTRFVDIGMQKMRDGSEIPLPPIILGELGNDPKKKTLLVYGHMDVQPALVEDGWVTDPFKLVEKDGKLWGRGSTDDKGPVLGWINAIEAYQASGIDIPVNFKFCLEGMEESGSLMLEQTVRSAAEADFFTKNVDFVCISDNYFLGKNKPCLTYGLRGNCYFAVEVEAAKQDLHSGVFGGSVPEAMIELSHIFASLVDSNGKILIADLEKEVNPVTDAERKLYENIDFDPAVFQADVGCGKLTETNKTEILMRRWRHPSLSIHGVHGAFAEPGEKTVIPAKVTGKFSIRIVPSMTHDHIEKCVVDHVMAVHSKLNTKNKVKCYYAKQPSKPWLANYENDNFKAAHAAVRSVWGIEPDLTREGGSIPVTLVFEEVTGKSVLLLPMGSCDDGAHSQNEKLNRENYIKGTKVMAEYIQQLGKL